MSKLITLLMALGAVGLAIGVGKKVVVDSLRSSALSEKQSNAKMEEVVIPPQEDTLKVKLLDIDNSKANLVLEAKNTVVFRGPVMGDSVAKAMKDISKISRNLSKSDPIYLVLDTPGGSVMDGLDLIDFMAAVPQEIKTVTLFAASMGFQIVENNPGERIIIRNGTLMSHRAKGGVDGQFDGELESRYKMVKRKLDYLETVDSKRMGISLSEYRAKIKDELWVHGFDAKAEKVADSMVLIQCGDSLVGEDIISIKTFLGDVSVVFDACPLLRDPIRVDMSNVRPENQDQASRLMDKLFHDKTEFVKDIIMTGKYDRIFR